MKGIDRSIAAQRFGTSARVVLVLQGCIGQAFYGQPRKAGIQRFVAGIHLGAAADTGAASGARTKEKDMEELWW